MEHESDPTQRPGTVHRVKKARKAQDCSECVVPIAVGQSYMYLNSFDEQRRRWSRYILCRSCERWRACHLVTELELGLELAYTAGKLRESVLAFAERIAGYKTAFRAAWKEAEEVARNEAQLSSKDAP